MLHNSPRRHEFSKRIANDSRAGISEAGQAREKARATLPPNSAGLAEISFLSLKIEEDCTPGRQAGTLVLRCPLGTKGLQNDKLVSLRKRMGSGDPPGLQNRRAASSMSSVRSTRTRFRHFSTTYRQRNHSEISSPGQAPCERPSSELAPSHLSRCRRRCSSWCGCPRDASAFAGRRLTSPQRRATSGRCAAWCGY